MVRQPKGSGLRSCRKARYGPSVGVHRSSFPAPVTGSSSSGSRIVINGVQLGATGQVTGLDTIPLLTIGGGAPAPGSFDPRSTFNGCLIANASACAFIDVQSNFPVQDVIEEEADAVDEDGNGQSLPVPLITMRDLDPLSGEPLLDDPVTGAGNDDLWTPTLDECDPAGTCPAAE